MEDWIDLGSGYRYHKFGWHPDRTIPANAERYKDVPDVEWLGIIISCPHNEHGGGVFFSIAPKVDALFSGPTWNVESWEPLTISPSILMSECGCHGFIRQGRWVGA